MTTKNEKIGWFHRNMELYGVNFEDRNALRRIEMTLSRWSEAECGNSNDYGAWAIERDETTERPYMVRHHYWHGQGKDTTTRTPIPDREKGARRRAEAIMARYPDLFCYYQGDPRGCSLYILRRADYPADKQAHGCAVDYTRGVAVCI